MSESRQFTAEIYRSISEIDRAGWDLVYPRIPEGYGFLKTAEETLTRQYKFRYILMRDAAGLACIAPCFIFDYPLDTTLDGFYKKFASVLKKAAPRLLTPRVLACGSPVCEGRIGLRDGCARHSVVKALALKMEKLAAEEDASIVAFRDFSDRFGEALSPLNSLSYHKARSLPTAEMDITFRSFDEYFSKLSPATQNDLKRKFKKTDGKVKIEMEVVDDLGPDLDGAYNLYLNTFRKSDMAFEEISKEFFRDVSKNMPGETKFFLWKTDGRLVAFHLTLVSGETIVSQYIGFDYDAALKYHLYFVAFRDRMKWCIRNGIRRYEDGQSNYDPKKRLDFRLVNQYIYFKHRNPAANFILGCLKGLLEPEDYTTPTA